MKTTIQGCLNGVQVRVEAETGPGGTCLLLISEDDLRRFVREECAKIATAAAEAEGRLAAGLHAVWPDGFPGYAYVDRATAEMGGAIIPAETTASSEPQGRG